MSSSTADLLIIAHQHYQTNQLAEAEALYCQVLKQEPQHMGALTWLALIASQTGKLEESIAYYDRILQINPNTAEAHGNLGSVLCQMGRATEAIAHHRQALALMPQDAEAHYNLGVALYQNKQVEEAIVHYQQAVTLNPNHVSAHANLGLALYAQGDRDGAIHHYQRAIELKPDHVNAHNGLAVVFYHLGRLEEATAHCQQAITLEPGYFSAYNNLGTILQKQGRLDEAMAQYQKAIDLNPNYANAYDNLGTVYQERKNLDQAVAHYRKAIALEPKSANAYNNLGSALKELGRLEEAVACCKEAIRLQPSHADAHNNVGSSLVEQARFDEAIAHYEQAIRHNPNHINAHLNLGIILLMLGNFERGFAEYHWRWQSKQCPDLRYPNALWDGADLNGKIILLTAEQGFGDTIQFARYAPLVAARGGRVVVACQKPLLRLLDTLPGIDRCVDRDKVNVETHFHAPLLDVPMILGTTVETIPANVPYLSPPPSEVKLPESNANLKIGMVWASNPDNVTSKKRTCPLSLFLKLAEIPGVALYSLQKDLSEDDRHLLEATPSIHDLSSQLNDFGDTAAAIDQLDLVISVDTAVAHLAGALAKPVWTLLPFVADWRWLRNRQDSPWYPTMHLFWQEKDGDWEGVFVQVEKAIKERKAEGRGQRAESLEFRVKSAELNDRSDRSKDVGIRGVLPLDSPNLLQKCRHGLLLFDPQATLMGRSLARYGEWLEAEVNLFQSLLKQGDTVVEVGAGVGAHTVFLAKAVGNQGRVVAIALERLVFQNLCANLALNGITNTDCYQSLDSLELIQCHLLKISLEEYEMPFLQKAAEVLQRWQPVIYMESVQQKIPTDLMRSFVTVGYDLYWHSPSLFSPKNFFQETENIFDNATATNILGFHKAQNINVQGMERVEI